PYRRDRTQRVERQRGFAERSVQVDDVEPRRASRPPALRCGDGIVAVDGLLRRVTVAQPHHAPVPQVNGRIHDHGAISRKLRRMRWPTAWLFSGWGWMPKMFPRPTTEANVMP